MQTNVLHFSKRLISAVVISSLFLLTAATSLAGTMSLPAFVLKGESRVVERIPEVALTWSDMSQTKYTEGAEVKYVVLRFNKNDGAKQVYSGNEVSFVDREVSSNQTYYYIVSAVAVSYGIELTFKTSNPIAVRTVVPRLLK